MARGLAGRGFVTKVLTSHPHYPEWRVAAGYGQWSRRELIDGVVAHRLKHYVPADPRGLKRLISEISFGARLQTTRWQQSDVIVAVSPALISTAMALARAMLFHRRTPVIVWVQDLYSLGLTETGQGGGLVSKVMRAVEGWTLRHADRVVVIHERFARRVEADFGIARDRIEVIRNWTHLPPSPEIDVLSARRRFGWGDEAVVLHSGNMGVKQGLDNVVEAARLAEKRGDNVRFVLVGNGAERARLEAAGADISTLQFHPPLDDDQFAAALRAADVLLVNEKPGVSEMAVPSKLTSYFSAGRPVLAATDTTGITADEVRASEGGVVVPTGDPRALVDAAVTLAADKPLCRTLGENGRRYRHTVLDETFAIDRFATLLTRLIDGDDRALDHPPHDSSPIPL